MQAVVAAFVAPVSRVASGSSLNMMFNFMKKKEPAPSSKKAVGKKAPPKPEFAYGLVGSDIESPNFDPLQLSAGRSEETVNWYRAAELKVTNALNCPHRNPTAISCLCAVNLASNDMIAPYECDKLLQHGRVCMLASLGLSVAPVLHFNDPVFDTTLGYGKTYCILIL